MFVWAMPIECGGGVIKSPKRGDQKRMASRECDEWGEGVHCTVWRREHVTAMMGWCYTGQTNRRESTRCERRRICRIQWRERERERERD